MGALRAEYLLQKNIQHFVSTFADGNDCGAYSLRQRGNQWNNQRANGVANFNLTYLKTSAKYTVDRIRATTVVQGTESASQIIFRLPAAVADVGTTPTTCKLSSPYNY